MKLEEIRKFETVCRRTPLKKKIDRHTNIQIYRTTEQIANKKSADKKNSTKWPHTRMFVS